MKNLIFILIAAVTLAATPIVSAQMPMGGPMEGEGQGMMGQGMMGKGMMDGDKGMMMHKMMGKGMKNKEVVATSDGGIVILIGNKLMKYDKNLNLVKEAEIKIDAEDMQNMCGMCMKMMGQEKMREADDSNSDPEEADNHEAHH